MVFGISARSEYRRGKAALGLLGVYTSTRDAFLLTERGETRGEPESSRRTVLPELSRPVSQEIPSPGNSVAATIFPRKFCRSILTQRPHFLGNSVALLHRDTLPRSTAEFDIGGGTRGYWDPVSPLMSREEAASYIGNVVAALK